MIYLRRPCGIELDGTNYLDTSTDAALETDGDVLDETAALDRALFAVEPGDSSFASIILDACRDNPFAKTQRSELRGLRVDRPRPRQDRADQSEHR